MPHDWKESTKEQYAFNLGLHVYPIFGNHRIDEIRRKDLKAFFDQLLSGGLASGTAALIKAPFNGVLSHALDSELIESNPLRDLKFIRKQSSFNVVPLTEQELIRLLDAARTYYHGAYYPSFLCALHTGMRIGELQALKWNDIDFEKRLIEIKRSYRRERITDTKNRKRRRVDMTNHLAETLKALSVTEKKAALMAGRAFPEWVFTRDKGQMLNRETFKNALERCLKSAGLRRIRTHDLRHSYATIRLLKGHNVGDVSYQMGHSSIKITYDTYGHWIPGSFKSEVDELDNLHPNAPYPHPIHEGLENLYCFQRLLMDLCQMD